MATLDTCRPAVAARSGGGRLRPIRIVVAAAFLVNAPAWIVCAWTGSAWAATPGADGGTEADAEAAVQAYLRVWSDNRAVTAAAVERFYAPHVIYYGKHLSRAGVLADKQAYIKAWPQRAYREVPGSFAAHCNPDRSLCRVRLDMAWRRVSRANIVSTGRAHMRFDFVPADGARKIARESARIVGGVGG